ncbi:hypothetical protein OG896_24610 [Streptomyces sp. NBC_00669]|uniref:hypothetical protein n=1 Tax=Streptomyces sp. NBC_00669 TaxID=2976011 RepID=UPI002E331D1A|nr:hypothetical protein [Streptomyces sp. NBC_00669]
MTTLEFIAAVKWPVTVLLLALLLVVALRSPSVRRAVGAWLRMRNLSVGVGQAHMALNLVQTEAALGIAADGDSELAQVVAGPESPDEEPQAQRRNDLSSGPQVLEIARRQAVEDVARSAAALGFEWAQAHDGQPEIAVQWTGGVPSMSIREPASRSARSDAVPLDVIRACLLSVVRVLNANNQQILDQQAALRRNVHQRLHQRADQDSNDAAEAPPGGTRSGRSASTRSVHAEGAHRGR